MSGASPKRQRRGNGLTALLTHFLHPDVIPLVLLYEVTIQFELQRIYGGSSGSGDGEMNRPSGLLLHADELFVVDRGNQRIQVFHQATGRFLRKWGRRGHNEGEFIILGAAAVDFQNSQDVHQKEPEIFITDDYYIHVFRLSDSRFLRRFAFYETGQRSWCGGIEMLGDNIVISRSLPTQIVVLTKSEGKQVRIMRMDLGNFPGKLILDDHPGAKELLIADPVNDRVIAVDIVSGQWLREYSVFDPLQQRNTGSRGFVMHGAEVIVCCEFSHRLVVFDRSSTQKLRVLTNVAGDKADQARPDSFSFPHDLAVSSRNELFVCDSGKSRVLIFQ